jgi:hypothetical protein
MPRAGQVKAPVQERLSDRIAIGVLTATFPPELVDRVIEGAGRRERRHRLLPARVVVYLVLALALFSGQAYEEVARLLTEGWRGPGAGGAPGRCRRPRRSPAPGSGLALGRCRRCSPRSLGHWRSRAPWGRGIGAGGCWRSTGPPWMCPTPPPTRLRLGGPRPAGASGPRSRRSACWRWPSAAPTRSSPPCWDRSPGRDHPGARAVCPAGRRDAAAGRSRLCRL